MSKTKAAKPPPLPGPVSHTFDLSETTLREMNHALHQAESGTFAVVNPRGAHAVAAGIFTDIDVVVNGSVGYYCAGMHQHGRVRVEGNASTGLAENIMSGEVRISGNATMSAGATGCGGLVVVEGNAGARCGISMKGVDIVVGGNVGHMSAFMAQAGNLVVLGDADHDLGDSIYEAELFVRGTVASLGSDCVEKPIEAEHRDVLERLLTAAGLGGRPEQFRRFGSARTLYNFAVDDIDAEVAGTSRNRSKNTKTKKKASAKQRGQSATKKRTTKKQSSQESSSKKSTTEKRSTKQPKNTKKGAKQ